MKKSILISLTSILLLCSADLFAKIKVVTVKGKVAYKKGRTWVPLRTNQVLSEGTKISSGTNSYAKIKIGRYNHILEVKPLTFLKVYSKDNQNSSRTHIGLKRGRLRATVAKKKRVRTVFKISTPVVTSSVRGTIQEVSYGPQKGMQITVIRGSIEGMNNNGRGALIQGKQVFSQKAGKENFENVLEKVKDSSFLTLNTTGMTNSEIDSVSTVLGRLAHLTGSESEMSFLGHVISNIKLNISWNTNP